MNSEAIAEQNENTENTAVFDTSTSLVPSPSSDLWAYDEIVAPSPSLPSYPFDLGIYEAPFFVSRGKDRDGRDLPPTIITHRLRKPTIQELQKHDEGVASDYISISAKEDQYAQDSTDADIALWDAIALEVKGYKNTPDWTTLTPEMRTRLRVQDKITAVARIYSTSQCALLANKEVSMFGDLWTIRQVMGSNPDRPEYVIYHTFTEPTKTQLRKFAKATQMRSQRGARKHWKFTAHDITVCVGLYDQLIDSIEGGTVQGRTFDSSNRIPFLAQIDATWKRQAIMTLMLELQGTFLD